MISQYFWRRPHHPHRLHKTKKHTHTHTSSTAAKPPKSCDQPARFKAMGGGKSRCAACHRAAAPAADGAHVRARAYARLLHRVRGRRAREARAAMRPLTKRASARWHARSERLAECTTMLMDKFSVPGDCGTLFLRSCPPQPPPTPGSRRACAVV